jgi:hypothetical protein
MSKGETVKYIIDADTSGFARGMAEAALESDIASKRIDRNLTKTARGSENNFRDIRKNAATAASQIRNFGVAMQAFNVTSLIIGVSALSGAIIELSGAIAAAGSTASILVPAFVQGAAGVESFKAGISGLGAAFKALSKNDGEAWAKAMGKLGPAAQSVAKSAGAIYNAFKSIQLNTQEALLNGIGDIMLKLGSEILPTVNAGMQLVGRSINDAFKSAAAISSTPLFQGLLATIFQDTAGNISILSKALKPLVSAFTDLYLITRPYVTLLAQWIVDLSNSAAAYLGSAKGQNALNLAIQEGIVALKVLGGLVGATFGLLTSLFRTSVNAGNALIPTLTGIIRSMEDWVNSAKGQAQLIALFRFTSLALQSVASAAGHALQFFFDIVQIVDSMNPSMQRLIVGLLATSLTVRPLISYLSKLYLAFRVLAVTIFNFVEQGIVVFGALGAVASVALVLATALIILGGIIRGPLGGALLIVGGALIAFIGLNYLLGAASTYTAGPFLEQGAAALQLTFTQAELASMNVLLATTMYNSAVAAVDAGAGMGAAATAASFLQVALLGLIIAAAGLVVILSMLGLFGSSAKKSTDATAGFSSSLTSLQKSMQGVGASGRKVGTGGLSALNDSLGQVSDSSEKAQGSLAAFDKMNVLTDNSAAGAAGIPGLPSLPNLDGKSLGAPTIDTGDFDKALKDMQKNFAGLQKSISKPILNPFAALGEWINSHPWTALLIFVGILVAVAAILTIAAIAAGGFSLAMLPVSLTIGLIVLGVVALIAIIILLVKNWDTVWATIKSVAAAAWEAIQAVWDGILNGIKFVWNWIKTNWPLLLAILTGPVGLAVLAIVKNWDTIKNAFSAAWNFIKQVWSGVAAWFGGVWNGIKAAFATVKTWFGSIFSGAWSAIKSAFSGVSSFFKGIWNTIVDIFGKVGTSIGNTISKSFKSVVNTALTWVADTINSAINVLNKGIKLFNKLPGPDISLIPTVTLPRLAKGGIITSPMFAQIGENGAEAVMPLENNTEWIDKLAGKINAANGGGNGQPIQLVVQIGEDKVANKIIDLINEKTQMGGRNTILV